jgi:uncharacterized membrane protein
MVPEKKTLKTARPDGSHAFRRAALRGLAVLVPPLLTVLIFLWMGSTINQYFLRPVTAATRDAVVWAVGDIRPDLAAVNPAFKTAFARDYYRCADDKFIPVSVYQLVKDNPGEEGVPQTSHGIYRRFVELKYLKAYYIIPFLLSIFMLLIYLLGKFMAAGIGRFFWNLLEQAILRLPLVRNVYSGVKQVSDFMFNERDFEFTRVVAVEYPRKGIWSIGFVTSESFLDIRAAANEPILAVYIPCSPLPLTGYTVNCLRSECVDLNMTFDQACQFMISCGVIVPPHQFAAERTGGDVPAAHAASDVNGVAELNGGR